MDDGSDIPEERGYTPSNCMDDLSDDFDRSSIRSGFSLDIGDGERSGFSLDIGDGDSTKAYPEVDLKIDLNQLNDDHEVSDIFKILVLDLYKGIAPQTKICNMCYLNIINTVLKDKM